MNVFVQVCVCLCVYKAQVDFGCCLWLSTLLFETRSLAEARVHWWLEWLPAHESPLITPVILLSLLP